MLINDNEQDVECVYDMDVETDYIFVDPEEPLNELCSIETLLTQIWKSKFVKKSAHAFGHFYTLFGNPPYPL